MNLLRSALFALVFYGWTAIAVFLAYPISLFGTRAARGWAHSWARYHRWCCANILGIESRVEGTPPKGAVLVAAKHQSMFETIEIVLMLDEPAIVLKRELSRIPFWGRIVTAYGAIPVDRTGGAATLRTMMRAAESAIAEGRPILIFPEGTRVRPGERPPLQPGFAGLYRALKLPVAALALDSGRIWPRGSFVKRPGIVTMRFAELVPAGLKRAEIEARVHEAINVLEMGS